MYAAMTQGIHTGDVITMRRPETRLGRRRVTLACGALVSTLLAGHALGAPASIEGTVKNSSGKGLRASIVLHDLSTPRTTGNVPFDRQFASKGDGSFLIGFVPPGKYEFCVSAMNERVLDPCVWTNSAVVVTVASGQSLTGVVVPVETGVLLQIRVNDPQGLLPAPKGGVVGDVLKVGVVRSNKQYLHARAMSVDVNGRDHYLVVPAKEQFEIFASSSKFSVSDSKGQNKANEDSRTSVTTESGKDLPVVTFSVGKP